MAKIRKFSVGQGISSITAFHGFKVNSEGELIYTKSTDDVDISDDGDTGADDTGDDPTKVKLGYCKVFRISEFIKNRRMGNECIT